MTGRVAIITLALALSPARLHAQDSVFTIGVPSADVHKGPSIATPVIGHVSRDTALPVERDLGSWVKVAWAGGPDGFGYLHVATGRLTPRGGEPPASKPATRTSPTAAPPATSAPSSAPSSSNGRTAAPRPRPARERVVVRSQQDASAISHVVGIGGLFGSMRSVGATSRVWRDDRLGFQVAFSRDVLTSGATIDRVTSMQVEPAVVYGLLDRVSDYFWIRPYVGSGLSIRHQTLHDAAAPAGGDGTSSNGVGVRVFGGGEATFAGAPRFALSADVSYRRFPAPFAGFEPARFSVSVSGHWYVR